MGIIKCNKMIREGPTGQAAAAATSVEAKQPTQRYRFSADVLKAAEEDLDKMLLRDWIMTVLDAASCLQHRRVET